MCIFIQNRYYFTTSFLVGQSLAIACFRKACCFTYPLFHQIHSRLREGV
ncbi:hypothetical protein [Calothrix sp. PCC 7507]|nr:hypothetical protein [Calothrix sp. PCC 7507]